jgi:hypothetical protein
MAGELHDAQENLGILQERFVSLETQSAQQLRDLETARESRQSTEHQLEAETAGLSATAADFRQLKDEVQAKLDFTTAQDSEWAREKRDMETEENALTDQLKEQEAQTKALTAQLEEVA